MSELDTAKSKSKQSSMGVRRTSTSTKDIRSTAILAPTSMSRVKVRRQSYGFGGVSSIRPMERTSQLGLEFRRPPQLFLNTYQLDPHSMFHVANVLKIVNEVLDSNFENHKYNAQESPVLAIRLANEFMHRVKAMEFNRYRIISVVTIGQRIAQSYNNAISFIWDHERDSYVNSQREVTSAFIQVTIFAIYLD